MRVPVSWLKDYVDLSGVPVDELAERWTLAGLEVEAVEPVGDWWDRERLVVGAITRVEPHPDAERLVLAWVDHGTGTLHRVVTGAPNLMELRTAGDLERPLKVVFALEGVEIFDGHQEGWVKTCLKGRPVRGIMSDAMVCSEKEIGLSEDHTGILILPDDAPVGASLVDYLGDAVIDVDLTANLARAMNMVGIARETAAILGRPFTAPVPVVVETGARVADLVDVVIEAPDLCPRYTARVIHHLAIGPSPWWMQRRLVLSGMRPINNIVDITNYVMLEWGEPLHAFDYDRLEARAGGRRPRITVRRARAGERMVTLDEVDRALDTDTLLICDDAGPVAIAGVMGGLESEVTDATRTVLLEAAVFDFINVRRTSRAQKLASEAAMRFGRGVHPALALTGSTRASGLLADLAGGRVVTGIVDAYPRPAATVTVRLDAAEVRRLLGVDIPKDEIQDILRRLEFAVAPAADGTFDVTVPPHRLDVALPADLVEEIARIHGYDRLPSTMMADDLPPQRDNAGLRLEEDVRDALVGADLQEVISYRLVAIEHEAALLPGSVPDPADYVVLANPISPERSALRRSVLTGLLDALAANARFRERVALFEVGPVYLGRPGDLPDERRHVSLVMTGPADETTWRGGERHAVDFYDAKGAVETLLAHLGVAATWARGSHPSLHPARTAEVRAGDICLGHVGELHPQVRAAWDLGEATVAVAELDLDALQAVTGNGRRFRPFSSYPSVRQDLAVVVAEAITAGEVAEAIRSAGGVLLADLVLFDVYRGGQIGDGRKSLAWSLTFQAPDKTLDSKAVEGLRTRIVRALESKVGAELR
jgi:phenylalanyl-tRNA synthetase beta chain